MAPQITTKASIGVSPWIPVDARSSNFQVSMAAVVNGTLTYDIEHTLDNVLDNTITPTAFKNSTMVGQAGNKDGNYAFPVSAIRINVTAYTSGSVTLTILQSGGR